MKSPRLIAAISAAAVLALGGVWAWHAAGTARAWRAARPPLPALDGWPAAFATALRTTDGRVSAGARDPAALGELAGLYLANGFSAEAEQALRALVDFDPGNPRWPHHLGRLLADGGRLDEAVPLLQRAATLAPDSVATRLKLAGSLAKTNRAPAAAESYRQVLRLDAKNPWALVGLARLDLADGRWSAARLQLEEAERLAPDFSEAPGLLATVYERSGRADDAARARARAAERNRYTDPPDPWSDELWPRCFDVYRLRVVAASLAFAGRGTEAFPVLARALELSPGDARSLRQLGRLQLKLQQTAEARRSFEAAIAAAPRESATYLDLLTVCRAQNDAAGTARWIARGLEHCPDEAGLHFESGRALAAAGDLAAAERALGEAMRLGPEITSAYVERADLLFQLGRSAEAVAVLEAVLTRQPNRAQADGFVARARRARLASELQERLEATYRRTFGTPPP